MTCSHRPIRIAARVRSSVITFGNKNLLTLLAQASLLAQKTSYYQKWQVHRRARPESFGGRIDVHLSGRKSYDIHPAVLHSDALARVKTATGSYLLPMAYPEGCPTHPSYPAAHAVNAGACARADAERAADGAACRILVAWSHSSQS
jgi:hypothetical protein